ncbi:MAG: hypothetical protein QM775_18965 [Pirellulales bacterium]
MSARSIVVRRRHVRQSALVLLRFPLRWYSPARFGKAPKLFTDCVAGIAMHVSPRMVVLRHQIFTTSLALVAAIAAGYPAHGAEPIDTAGPTTAPSRIVAPQRADNRASLATFEEPIDEGRAKTPATVQLVAAEEELKTAAAPVAEATVEASLGEAQWIWSPTQVEGPAPKGAVFFRKWFPSSLPELAFLQITCDDKYEVYVNGRHVGEGKDWRRCRRSTSCRF